MKLQTIVAHILLNVAGQHPRKPIRDAVLAASATHATWGCLPTDGLVVQLSEELSPRERDALYSLCWQLTETVCGREELHAYLSTTMAMVDITSDSDLPPWTFNVQPEEWKR